MKIKNLWFTFANARKIADELQIKYAGQQKGQAPNLLEWSIQEDFDQHPLNDGEMFPIIHWDNTGCFLWIQVGINCKVGLPKEGYLVPR